MYFIYYRRDIVLHCCTNYRKYQTLFFAFSLSLSLAVLEVEGKKWSTKYIKIDLMQQSEKAVCVVWASEGEWERYGERIIIILKSWEQWVSKHRMLNWSLIRFPYPNGIIKLRLKARERASENVSTIRYRGALIIILFTLRLCAERERELASCSIRREETENKSTEHCPKRIGIGNQWRMVWIQGYLCVFAPITDYFNFFLYSC